MQESTNTVTDVEFKEVEEKVVAQEEAKPEVPYADFNPVTYMIEALTKAGHPNPTAWTLDIDPRAQNAEKVEDRIFFTNRALHLYVAEHVERENITPRMIFAEGLPVPKWIALMEQGIVKWLMGKFDKKTEEKKETSVEGQEEVRVGYADVTDTATNVFSPEGKLKEVVVAGGIDIPADINPEDFNQSFDAPKTAPDQE
jgi:hypothetical protein